MMLVVVVLGEVKSIFKKKRKNAKPPQLSLVPWMANGGCEIEEDKESTTDQPLPDFLATDDTLQMCCWLMGPMKENEWGYSPVFITAKWACKWNVWFLSNCVLTRTVQLLYGATFTSSGAKNRRVAKTQCEDVTHNLISTIFKWWVLKYTKTWPTFENI